MRHSAGVSFRMPSSISAGICWAGSGEACKGTEIPHRPIVDHANTNTPEAAGNRSQPGFCFLFSQASRFGPLLQWYSRTTSVAPIQERLPGSGVENPFREHGSTKILAGEHRLSSGTYGVFFTRTSFMIRPETFQSCTYRLPSLSQYDPCVPLKIPSIHLSCGTLKLTRVAGSGL